MNPQPCQICQVNPATIHLTEIKEGSKNETHICEACAAAQGLAGEGLQASTSMLDIARGLQPTSHESCPHCGITWEEFKSKGRFGCPRDYEVFRDTLMPLLQKMHGGAARHLGRLPRGRDEVESVVGDRLLHLRRELSEAIKEEQYEVAARLRDEIRAIERAAQSQTPWTQA